MGFHPRFGLLPGYALALAASLASAAETNDVRVRAERLAHEGRCGAALPELERALARAADPERARLRLLAGQCLVRMGRYAEAVRMLEEAERAEPELAGLPRVLLLARYHAGDLEGAERALERAAGAEPEDAELLLYRGLLLLARGDADAAAPLLERARSRDRERVEPVASYYAGRAWQRLGSRRRAQAALDRVRTEWPGSAWAREADRALAPPADGGPADGWGSLSVGFEYDDNVVLRGDGVQLPAEISSERDTRLTWSADAGVALAHDEHWTLGTQIAYAGSAYRHLEDFNAHHPSLSVWLDRRLDERTTARLLADFSYAWVDSAPFRLSQRTALIVTRRWQRRGATRLVARFLRHDFRFPLDDVPDGDGGPGSPCAPGVALCGPAGLDEARARNRDGDGIDLEVGHEIPVRLARGGAIGETRLRGRLRYARFAARGTEYSHQAYGIGAGARTRLPFDLVLDASADWVYRPYRHPSTFPDPNALFENREYGLRGVDRRERTIYARVSLERALSERVRVSARWSYVRNRSNTDVFQHDRQRIGAVVTLDLGR